MEEAALCLQNFQTEVSPTIFFFLRCELHSYPIAWTAPSAISLGGIGGGFELGVEITDFVIVLNSTAAVEPFKKGSNVTLGGNMTVALGPLGLWAATSRPMSLFGMPPRSTHTVEAGACQNALRV